MRNTPLAKEREHMNRVMRPHGAFVLVFLEAQINIFAFHKTVFVYFPYHNVLYNKTIIEFGFCDIRNN